MKFLDWVGEHPALTIIILIIVLSSIPTTTTVVYRDRGKRGGRRG